MNFRILAMLAILRLATLSICGETNPEDPAALRLHPFQGLGRNTLKSFAGRNLMIHVAGIGATYLLISQDVDYRVHVFFNENSRLENRFFPVGLIGALGPVGIGAGLYFYGKRTSKEEITGAGCAVLQSSLITFTAISLMKAITGRPNPDADEYDDMKSLSRTFRFGFMRGGIFWGWPSGHTGAVMSAVSALTSYYPENKWMKVAGYLTAAYTVAGVCAIGEGGMHWLSDGVAGCFTGYAIGTVVGRYYREYLSEKMRVVPVVGKNSSGFLLSCSF
jgi:membrane-associated phospholipid phosphatase